MSSRGEQVALAVAAIQERLVELGGAGVRIMGVTKAHGPWAIRAAHEAGLGLIGENYAQEVRDKADVLSEVRSAGVRVHFIGALQTNKVRMVATHVDVVQSVDRLGLIDELAKRAAGCAVMVQVHHGDEDNKAGCSPHEVPGLVDAALNKGLRVEGLMTVGPTSGDRLETGRAFAATRALVDTLGLQECSMGMTDDLDLAVAEGTTMIRVGRALFGER